MNLPTPAEIKQMADGDMKRLAMFTNAVIEMMTGVTLKVEDDSLIFDVTDNTIKAFDLMKMAECFSLAYILTSENNNVILTIY